MTSSVPSPRERPEADDAWGVLVQKMNQATDEADATIRDWTRPSAEMHNMENWSGATLRAACSMLGLATSGPKYKLAGRLLDAGLTAAEVKERYGWRGRSSTKERAQ